MVEQLSHEDCVLAWLKRNKAKSVPREALINHFEEALAALWTLTSTTLGEVTLTAIGDRVLHSAAERFPGFGSLRAQGNGRLQIGDLRGNTDSLAHLKLMDGMQFVLVEFLTIIGSLTAEVLTPELHAELCNGAPGTKAAPRRPTGTARTGRKDQRA